MPITATIRVSNSIYSKLLLSPRKQVAVSFLEFHFFYFFYKKSKSKYLWLCATSNNSQQQRLNFKIHATQHNTVYHHHQHLKNIFNVLFTKFPSFSTLQKVWQWQWRRQTGKNNENYTDIKILYFSLFTFLEKEKNVSQDPIKMITIIMMMRVYLAKVLV